MISFYIAKVMYLIFGIVFTILAGYCAKDYFGTYKTDQGDWLDLAFFGVTATAAIGCFWMV